VEAEPRKTKLVLAIGGQAPDLLETPLRERLVAFGDGKGNIEVIVSPFETDAHCPEGSGEMRPDQDFSTWCDALARRPPVDASFVWVFRHIDRSEVVGNLVALANDPDTGYVVLGEDPRCMSYLGSSVTYLPIGPMGTPDERIAVAYAIAESVLDRFPTPREEPLLPWALITRVNHQSAARAESEPRTRIRTPPPSPPKLSPGMPSPDGTQGWDDEGWLSIKTTTGWWSAGLPRRRLDGPKRTPTAPAQTEPLSESAPSGGHSDRGRWPWKRSTPTPPAIQEIGELFVSHTPLTIVVLGCKGGLGKTRACAGLLLAAQEASEQAGLRGVPLLGVDSDTQQTGLATLLGIQYPAANQVFPPLWEVIAEHTAHGVFREPAASDARIFVYRQGQDIPDLASMFDPDHRRTKGRYDLRRFLNRIHQQYRVVVVDTPNHGDVALLWSEVADGVVVVTDNSPQAVAMTQRTLSVYQSWRASDSGRAKLPIVCAWWDPFRPTQEVKEIRRKLIAGFDFRLPNGDLDHADGIPIIDIPSDRGLHNAIDCAGIRQSGAMPAYRSLFGLLIKSMGTKRLRI
jgi:MinD-like ATPase involved in chromosome partitioning or flagellar assembly